MNFKKILTITILILFTIGIGFMAIDHVNAASKTVKVKGYSVKLTAKEVKELNQDDHYYCVIKNTGKKSNYKVKKPVYKTYYKKKTVYKYKTKTTYVKVNKDYYTKSPKGYHLIKCTVYNKNGAKYFKYVWQSNKKYKTTKKVAYKKKVGYKTVTKKLPVKITLERFEGKTYAYLYKDLPAKGAYIEIWSGEIKI